MTKACSLLALVALAGVHLLAAPTGAAQPAEASAAESAPDKERARRLFDEGRTHYDLGEYEQAIARFREAYAASNAPILLFNVAQAHRLQGDCRQALEIYRHFVRLDPDSPQRASADEQIVRLGAQCGAPAPPVAQVVAPPAAIPQTVPRTDRGASRLPARLSTILLASGVALGGTTLGLYLWNDRRHVRWSDEDRRLSQAPAEPDRAAEHLGRQQRNDELIGSIQAMDRASVAMGIAAVALLVGAAGLPLWSAGTPEVAAAPGSLAFSWRLRWP